MEDCTNFTEDDQKRLAKGKEALYNILVREIGDECKVAQETILLW